LSRFLGLTNRNRPITRRRATTRLQLESLEDRVVPTVLFTPQNGAENATNGGGPVLGNDDWGAPIYTVFWGSYWSTSAGQSYAAELEKSINSTLYFSPYLDGLHQYGISNPAGVPGSGTVEVFNNSDPANGFTQNDVHNVALNAIANQGIPESDTFTNQGIVFVITPPGATYSNPNVIGLHSDTTDNSVPNDSDDVVYGWLNSNSLDSFTTVLSHETAEAMTDPHGDAWQVDPRNGSNWNEICDNEAENYTYRLNSYLTQSYWSQADSAYMVTDGNSETVTVNGGELIVNGGQQGLGYNDTFVVGENSSGGVQVTLDGQVFSFDPGQISYVQLNTQSGGTSTVYVGSTPSSVPVYVDGQGTDQVIVGDSSGSVGSGSGYMGNINSYVDVYGSGSITVNVDDSGDSVGQSVSVSTTSQGDDQVVVGGAAPVICSSTCAGLHVYGGSGGNTFNVQGTAAGTPVTLNAGAGGDSINVGDAADPLDGIQGALAVNGKGNTTLTFNDTKGSAAPNHAYDYYLAQNSFSRTGTATVTFSGMASVNLDTANAGSASEDVIYVSSTAAGTSYQVNAGTGFIDFIVADNNYTLNGIQGSLYLHGAGGTLPNDDIVALYDVDKTTHHTLVLTGDGTSNGGFVQRDGVTNIHYDRLDAYAVLQTAGSIGATVNVQSEAANLYTSIYVGSADKVTIGNTSHTMAGILGDLRITANDGQTPTVTLDDSQDANAKTITMSTNTTYGYQIAGLLPPSSVGYGLIWLQDAAMHVTLKTGAGSTPTNDVFQVNDLTAAPVMKIDAGNGNNTLVGPNQATTWSITGANSGKLGSISFSNVQNLVGGTGVDDFKFSSTSAKVLSINGGGAPTGQGDWLDYSSLPSSSTVTVNLATGSATNVNGGAAGAVTSIQNVIGSTTGTNNLTGDSQGNILIGGSGLNTIVGGSGSSLLIGGSGHGSITGGSGTDILIAGTTTYNATTTAGETSLMAILAELQSADTFAQKVYDLIHGNNSGGGHDLNGSNKLTWGGSSATVKASSGAFTLKGDTSASSAADWFFSNSSSTVTDFNDDGVQDEHNNNALGVF
jgi:hypothetical protein